MNEMITLEWLELRTTALSATRRGWPVVPGTFPTPDRRWHGRDDATTLAPIQDSWQNSLVTDPDHAYDIWRQHPYGVLLVCGRGVDVLQLPYRLEGLLPALPAAGMVVPVALSGPPPRWELFVATDSGTLLPELTLASVRRHGAGAWVALPPTTLPHMVPARWTAPPPSTAGRPLSTAQEVQQVLLDALLRSGLATRPDDDAE